jgi:hypothetical protein
MLPGEGVKELPVPSRARSGSFAKAPFASMEYMPPMVSGFKAQVTVPSLCSVGGLRYLTQFAKLEDVADGMQIRVLYSGKTNSQ